MAMNFNLPNIYIIVKQLSNAKPTRKRHKLKVQKLLENAVATPVNDDNYDETMFDVSTLKFPFN